MHSQAIAISLSYYKIIIINKIYRAIPITKEERIIIVQKICVNMQKLNPLELPPLTYQLFLLCNNNAVLVIIAILKLHKYFHKCRYYKVIKDMDSDVTDYNSIGKLPEI